MTRIMKAMLVVVLLVGSIPGSAPPPKPSSKPVVRTRRENYSLNDLKRMQKEWGNYNPNPRQMYFDGNRVLFMTPEEYKQHQMKRAAEEKRYKDVSQRLEREQKQRQTEASRKLRDYGIAFAIMAVFALIYLLMRLGAVIFGEKK